MKWFMRRSDLERDIPDWERRLQNVSDKRALKSELEMSGRMLSEFGLGGFDDATRQSILDECVHRISIKQIVVQMTYHSNLDRWISQHWIAVWTGVALMLLGVFLSPVVRWVRAGR